ncbi:ABC transporter permease [Salinispira pacifica]|uniref:Ferric iron ABC transporter, permease protein n=1 Tax=Salinispira pacifica TaxID=1307761 RepID=V5WF50_9SPIO|nr:iron ABC transporter permease [Salinispira pacifica]AHC14169.1 Ferric iron ABC transporter, permease protein [Salinispira pacifica]
MIRNNNLRGGIRFLPRLPLYPSWVLILGGISVLLILPFLGPLYALLRPGNELWQHLKSTVLPDYLRDTLVLSLSVMAVTAVMGAVPAWIVSRYRFPLRRMLDKSMLLPLAIPAYITAYAYAGMTDYFGPLWNLGTRLGMSGEALRSIRFTGMGEGMGGLILVMSFALHPYVYVILRHQFRFRITSSLEAARSLGAGELKQFFALALPASIPSLTAALTVVLMELLNEYGAVVYYGRNTITTGIFRAWFGFYDLPAARRLGGVLMLSVLAILFLFFLIQRRKGYGDHSPRELTPIRLRGMKRLIFPLLVMLPMLLGFAFPLIQLLSWGVRVLPGTNWSPIIQGVGNTLGLGVLSGILIVILSIAFANGRRLSSYPILNRFSDLSLVGHSVPGAVIALGVLGIASTLGQYSSVASLVQSGLMLLIFAYVVRFIAVSHRAIAPVMEYQLKKQDEASRSLGAGPWKTLFRIHLPSLYPAIFGALALSFLEVVKELPLTMILRPFNFNTLAVRAYELAANEMVQEAAVPSLILVALGLLGVILIQHRSET